MDLESSTADYFDRNENDDDHYTQPGDLYRKAMSEEDRLALVVNIVNSMLQIEGELKEQIINRQLCHFFRLDSHLGESIASSLGIKITA